MRAVQKISDDWVFHDHFVPELIAELWDGEAVSLPHNAVKLPFNYFDEKCYQHAFIYQKKLPWQTAFEGKEVVLRFDAAMADAVVCLNGKQVAAHKDGYTPFEARLTDLLVNGDNLITVKIDGSENPEIPPFGGMIDYLTYAGIYRDVWLEIRSSVSIAKMKVETGNVLEAAKSASVRCWFDNPQDLPLEGVVVATLKDGEGSAIVAVSAPLDGASALLRFDNLTGLALWDIDNPVLYEISVELTTTSGTDQISSKFGFRTAEFTPDGFLLNGKPLKLMGLNRHQSFPYVGYAMGRSAQEQDAELVKRVLKCNVVRTSHYPQSTYFLDHCDRIGLLVFEEIPGWQHIGGPAWKAESVENVRRMIERDWNHPSIIIWGVRINKSQDDHDFYTETNRLARELDPTRQTGGVRYIDESELLEDVYTMNDFSQGSEELPGNNRPHVALRNQREVTGLSKLVPYLVTEFNGHMYPTKRTDQEQRQAEHVSRHLRVLDAMHGDPNVSGCIGWCMFDYNTHQEFGSGDRICYHGVMDMFREPKFAAYAYISQCDPSDEVVLKPVTYWARGERNIGGVLPLIILTNCDEIEFRYGNQLSKRAGPDRQNYPHLPHPPIVFDERHFRPEEMGLWGSSWQDGTLVGYINGEAVKAVQMSSAPVPTTLQVEADQTSLNAMERDTVRVIARVLDQTGNVLPYLEGSMEVDVAGPAILLGPNIVPIRGGIVGFWLQANGEPGDIDIGVYWPGLGGERIRVVSVGL